MIVMKPASDLVPGDVFSTDGYRVQAAVRLADGRMSVTAWLDASGGITKNALLAPDFPCPIWTPDENMDVTKLSDKAFSLGHEHGHSAGTWVIDGNTSPEQAALILKGYEDGDPQIMDMEPAPLSGEWADSPTPQTLADDLELPEDYRGTELDQLCTDYELGFSEGFWDEVQRAAKTLLD